MITKTLGQVAYEAYADSTEWKSAVSGAPLPQWDIQSDKIKEAWERGAAAARNYVVPPWPIVRPDPSRAYSADELRFSAHARCVCGAGLAYAKNDEPATQGAWRCAAALMHTLPVSDTYHGRHDVFPFATYEVKSEDQPSAKGATTRPAKVDPG